jgi:hypothetical protein
MRGHQNWGGLYPERHCDRYFLIIPAHAFSFFTGQRFSTFDENMFLFQCHGTGLGHHDGHVHQPIRYQSRLSEYYGDFKLPGLQHRGVAPMSETTNRLSLR